MYRAMEIAPAGQGKAWILIFNVPMVILVDSNGQLYQTGYASLDSDMKNLREKNTTEKMFKEARKKDLQGHRIAADGLDNCFVLTSMKMEYSIKHVSLSGNISTVISGLEMETADGLAYLSDSVAGRGKVLFGYGSKGMHSVKWPRGFWSGLFSSASPLPFSPERVFPLSIAVDNNSELIGVGDLSSKVFVLNREGQKISEYIPEDKETFTPDCIAFDHTGCIIVLNRHNSAVVRLSVEGRFLQTIIPEIDQNSTICDACKKLNSPPKCRACKDTKRILGIAVEEDILWVSRISGEVEVYRLY